MVQQDVYHGSALKDHTQCVKTLMDCIKPEPQKLLILSSSLSLAPVAAAPPNVAAMTSKRMARPCGRGDGVCSVARRGAERKHSAMRCRSLSRVIRNGRSHVD
eukprot:2980657-Pleurochrysis_carterae.AAC.9